MLGKEVKVYLKDGTVEVIACTVFKIGIDQGKSALIFQVGPERLYLIHLEKVSRYDINFIWIFDDRPFFPPSIPTI